MPSVAAHLSSVQPVTTFGIVADYKIFRVTIACVVVKRNSKQDVLKINHLNPVRLYLEAQARLHTDTLSGHQWRNRYASPSQPYEAPV